MSIADPHSTNLGVAKLLKLSQTSHSILLDIFNSHLLIGFG